MSSKIIYLTYLFFCLSYLIVVSAIQENPYPGRYSGQTKEKIDPETEEFPQDDSNDPGNCKHKIYHQKIKRYTLQPPYLFKEHDKGYFSAYEFNKCYFFPKHWSSQKWYDQHNFMIKYDKNMNKFKWLAYGSSDIGCLNNAEESNWMTLEEFNLKYSLTGYLSIKANLTLSNTPIDYAIYTSMNSDNENCLEKEYGERLYYKYDIYWSKNDAQNGWYLVQYKVVENQGNLICGRFDQYWGPEGAERLQDTWCLDGTLNCGQCYRESGYYYSYVECGDNYIVKNGQEKYETNSFFLWINYIFIVLIILL